jgi:hypothetical protein
MCDECKNLRDVRSNHNEGQKFFLSYCKCKFLRNGQPISVDTKGRLQLVNIGLVQLIRAVSATDY